MSVAQRDPTLRRAAITFGAAFLVAEAIMWLIGVPAEYGGLGHAIALLFALFTWLIVLKN